MKVEPVVTPGAARTRLLTLISTCDSFSLTSAWVTSSEVFDAALAARRKLIQFVIGTHHYFTCADCLDKCVALPQAKVMQPVGPLFHPKLYIFHVAGRVVVYVGSSNFTGAGFSTNVECGVFVSGDADHPQLQQFVDFTATQWSKASKLDADFVANYRANKKRVKDAQAALDEFIPVRKPRRTDKSANNVVPGDMDWAHFIRLVRKDRTNGLKSRLAVLSRARQLFSQGTFAELDPFARRCLAGVQRPSLQVDGLDWGYFGQMSAHGAFSPVLETHYKTLSRALAHIPLLGPVNRKHYDAYCAVLLSIPGVAPTWIGIGTRLLAMKRPDRFVCIDGPNKHGLCGYFGVAPTTTNLANYWQRIAEPMAVMPWWQAESPVNRVEQQVWLGRATMLDAIYFDPTHRKR